MARSKAKKSPPAKKPAKVMARKKRPEAKAAVTRNKPVRRNVEAPTQLASVPVCFRLPENCDAAAAKKLRSDLIAIRGGDVQLDASQVRRVGVLSIQVLLSAKKTWNFDGKNFELVHPAGELSSSLALLGLAGNGEQVNLVIQ